MRQRTMPTRRREEALFAALDIGASKVSCIIARPAASESIRAEIIGVGHYGLAARSKGAPSADQLEIGIRNAVDAAERMAGERINKVWLSAPGRFLRTRRIGVDLEISGGIVTEEDVDDALNEGAEISTAQDCAAIHALPIGFRVDGEEIFSDPVGLSGATLFAEMLGIGVRHSVLDNYSALVERCGLRAEEFVAGPLAAAEATLFDDEKELGVALIDIGASSTGYAVYDGGFLVDCGGIPVGGGHITKDIAQIFGAPLAQAERIKTVQGAALIGPGDEHRIVDFPQLGADGDRLRASRADLCEVIISRMEEIFELVAQKLPEDAIHKTMLRRVVITGGGSLLVGAREIAERSLSMKCRLGRPVGVAGAPDATSAPGFAVCAGLLQQAVNSGAHSNSSLGLLGQSRHAEKKARVFGGVEAWLRAKF